MSLDGVNVLSVTSPWSVFSSICVMYTVHIQYSLLIYGNACIYRFQSQLSVLNLCTWYSGSVHNIHYPYTVLSLPISVFICSTPFLYMVLSVCVCVFVILNLCIQYSVCIYTVPNIHIEYSALSIIWNGSFQPVVFLVILSLLDGILLEHLHTCSCLGHSLVILY